MGIHAETQTRSKDLTPRRGRGAPGKGMHSQHVQVGHAVGRQKVYSGSSATRDARGVERREGCRPAACQHDHAFSSLPSAIADDMSGYASRTSFLDGLRCFMPSGPILRCAALLRWSWKSFHVLVTNAAVAKNVPTPNASSPALPPAGGCSE